VTARLLQQSPGRTVVVEEGGDVVCKTFSGGPTNALLRLAEAERDRLDRFSRAVNDIPGARCPRPLDVRTGDGGVAELRMERMPGLPLLGFLRGQHVEPELADTVAGIAAAGATRYVDALGEPYDDFQFDNMLFDEASRVLTFVDLGLPDGEQAPPVTASPLEATLGNLVGSTMLQSARPKWVLAARQHRQAVALCAAIVARAAATPGVPPVSAAAVRACAVAAYRRSAFKGGRAGPLWYSTVGYVVARRQVALGVKVRPPLGPGHPHPMGKRSRAVSGRANRK
jgi:hypothetical protein